MATYTKTVDPNGGSDYLSIALWEAGEQSLYLAGDTAIANCLRTGPLKDISYTELKGWPNEVVTKIVVDPLYRHEGKVADTRDSDGNYIYTVERSGSAFRISKHDCIIEHVLINTGDRGILCNSPFGVSGCFIRFNIINSTTGTGSGVIDYGVYGDTSVYSNVIIGFNGAGQAGIKMSSAFRNIQPYVYNNTIYNCDTGIVLDGHQIISNNLVIGCATCYSGAGYTGSDYNVSSDATAIGSTVAINKTDYTNYFIDHTTGDFRLKSDSESLFGIPSYDLSSEFNEDIDGDTRPADSTFGLGADYYVSSGGGVTGTSSHQASTATHSATGERVITGSASHSATTATHSASGVVSGQITGTANHQAIAATHTATGSRIVAGSSSHQASNATNSAIGERVVSGSCSHAANAATHVAVGDRSVTGSATHQANDAAHIAAGTRTITGNSSHQAINATGSAIVERVISGSSAYQASTATHSASGSVGGVIAGSANHQASTSTHSATGDRVISGISTHQANTSTHTSIGERIVTSVSSHTANTATHSATGSVGNVVSGTGNHAANDATHSATGLRIVGGTATNQAGNATHSASGTAQGTTTGTASHQATRATHNAIGLRLISGTASHQAQTATQAASDIPLVQIPLGLRQTSDITPVRGILNTTPSYGILKLG